MKRCVFIAFLFVLTVFSVDAFAQAGHAYIFLKRNGAANLGHVGGAFQIIQDGEYKILCFATENKSGKATTPANDPDAKNFWMKILPNSQSVVLQYFKDLGYTDWKRFDLNSVDQTKAKNKLDDVKNRGYNITNANCENDVYDVLHDESGYGISANASHAPWSPVPFYMGWVQVGFGPNDWFDSHVHSNDRGKL